MNRYENAGSPFPGVFTFYGITHNCGNCSCIVHFTPTIPTQTSTIIITVRWIAIWHMIILPIIVFPFPKNCTSTPSLVLFSDKKEVIPWMVWLQLLYNRWTKSNRPQSGLPVMDENSLKNRAKFQEWVFFTIHQPPIYSHNVIITVIRLRMNVAKARTSLKS